MPLLSHAIRAAAWQGAFALLEHTSPAVKRQVPRHLLIGQQGEQAAFFYLRRLGFTVTAKGWSSGRAPGDLDLVAWERETLCFVEVKTRSSRDVASAESAVDPDKRRSLRRLAGHYLRQMPEETVSRFDILSIYLNGPKGAASEFELFRNAFGWLESQRGSALSL